MLSEQITIEKELSNGIEVKALCNVSLMVKILKNIKVPTGNILVIEGDKGKLECL